MYHTICLGWVPGSKKYAYDKMRLRKVTIPLNGVDSNIELQNTKKLHNTEPGTEQHLRRKRVGKEVSWAGDRSGLPSRDIS